MTRRSLLMIFAIGCLLTHSRTAWGACDKPSKKTWTVLVYMVADHKLDSYATRDMIEMQTAGSSDDVNIVVQIDRESSRLTKRYYVQNDHDLRACETLPEVNTGSPKALKDFLVWGRRQFEASHYLIVLWGHGLGVGSGFVEDDKHPKDRLTIIELNDVLDGVLNAAKAKVDVLGFDACFMGAAEIAAQLKDQAAVMVASETLFPDAGWPYNTILKDLLARPTMTARELGQMIVDKIDRRYRHSASVAISALDLSHVTELVSETKSLVDLLNQAIEKKSSFDAVRAAFEAAGWYDVREFIDFRDLLHHLTLQQGAVAPTLIAQAGKLLDLLDRRQPPSLVIDQRAVLQANPIREFCGEDLQGTGGVTVWFPFPDMTPCAKRDPDDQIGRVLLKSYQALEWDKKTEWTKFIESYKSAKKQFGGT